jgi:hypothetical protein
LDLHHLRYFVTVAERLHFSEAAEFVHVSQPGLSQQIKALEEELGVLLPDEFWQRPGVNQERAIRLGQLVLLNLPDSVARAPTLAMKRLPPRCVHVPHRDSVCVPSVVGVGDKVEQI